MVEVQELRRRVDTVEERLEAMKKTLLVYQSSRYNIRRTQTLPTPLK